MNLLQFFICTRKDAIVIGDHKDEGYTTSKIRQGPLKLHTGKKIEIPKSASKDFKEKVKRGLWIPDHLLKRMKPFPYKGEVNVS